jgi:hypothetical protein
MVKHEGLIDISLPEDQPSQEQRPGITLSTNLRSRESAHSSDTIIKTPHRQSLTPLSPAALELYKNKISFHSADKLGLNGDLFAEHDVGPSIIHAQATGDLLSEMPNARQVKDAHASDNKVTIDPFLDKFQKEQAEPGGTEILWTSTSPQTLPDLPTIGPSAVGRSTSLTFVKNGYETSSCQEDNPPKSFTQDLTTSHEKFTIQPTVSKQIVPEFLETQYRQVAGPTDLHQTLTRRA